MARPKKQTVDYFPHSCTHKKTMFVLEQRFGNDGYAFWFKLLELLGSTDGHALDTNDEALWQYLQANARLEENVCVDMLNLLAKLRAIDEELWVENKIIWSDNFLEGIADVYDKRTVEMPEKPVSDPKTSHERGFLPENSTSEGVSGDNRGINPQSKVKESKVDESKVKDRCIRVQKLTMTQDEYQKLVDKYGQDIVDDKIQYARNYAPLMKKYKNLYLTLNNWLKSDAGGKSNGPGKDDQQDDKYHGIGIRLSDL